MKCIWFEFAAVSSCVIFFIHLAMADKHLPYSQSMLSSILHFMQ